MPPSGEIHPKAKYILGVDLARMGQDYTVMVVLEIPFDEEKERVYVVYIHEMKHKLLTEAIGKVIFLDKCFGFEKIFLDSTGLGAGPADILDERMPGRVVAQNFTNQSKEDMYSNLRKLMEQGRLKIPRHKKLIFQLRDLRYEISSSGHLKISHSDYGHDDYCDALALACMYFKDLRKNIGLHIF